MNNKIFFIIFLIIIYTIYFVLPAKAMGKRPARAKRTESEEFVSPEIEIITKPEMNIQLLSKQKQPPESLVSISPTEVIPTAGSDYTNAAKSSRTADIQRALINAGFTPGPIDGKLGAKTKKAIRGFQGVNSLTVDGIVGPKTWAKLKPYLYLSDTENDN